MVKPELHWISGSPYAWRVMLALEVKQVPYASRLLESSRGDLKTPEFLQLNPRGQVPVLTHGEFVLTESLAMLAYLEREFPSPPIFGRHARETARIWEAISEYLSYVHALLNRVIAPLYAGKAAEKADDIRAALPAVRAELGRLEERLRASRWLVGDAVSAADLVIFPGVRSLIRAAAKEAAAPLGLGLLPLRASFPRLAAWVVEIEHIPGYERTFPPHWKEPQPA